MPITTVQGLLTELRQLHLLDGKQLEDLARKVQGNVLQPRALAQTLIEQGALTPYQVNQLLQGRGQQLLLGSYVLLERLGEGGMGVVFKARNWKLGKVVAIKLMRKDRLQSPDAVRRFQREVRTCAQLSHPNIVHAVDADQVGETHLLVMEYVEGIDLGKRVKQSGALPIPEACECIRQAAVGLQHAHERNLIHRDIKPSNLMLMNTQAHGPQSVGLGVVKILDLGLARADHLTAAESTSTLTESGAVLGTPDYIAPEQAKRSREVDIRADLYSLGCTLYYLLTGQAPFSGETLGEKLLKHMLDEPTPVEQLRAEVPPGLAGVVRKLMAKRPEDRFQTPAEFVAVLEQGLQTGQWPVTASPGAPTGGLRGHLRQTLARWRQHRRLLLGCALLLGLAVLSFFWLLRPSSPLDQLSAEAIPVPLRAAQLPDLVAVLGEPTGGLNPQVVSLAFRADGKMLATLPFWGANGQGTAWLWELSGDRFQRGAGLKHPGLGTALALAPDGKTLAVALLAGPVWLWDLGGTEPRKRIEVTGGGGSLAFSPDGKRLACCSDRVQRIWDVTVREPRDGDCVEIGVGPEMLARALAFAPDGKLLACRGLGTELQLWDLTGAKPQKWDGLRARGRAGHQAMAFAPNGKTLACANDEKTVEVWTRAAEKFEPQAPLVGHGNTVNAVVFAPNGRVLASADADGKVIVWATASGAVQRSWPLGKPVYCLAFAPDSRHLAVGNRDGTVYILRLR